MMLISGCGICSFVPTHSLPSSLPLQAEAKQILLDMTPANYIGNAVEQAKNIRKFLKH